LQPPEERDQLWIYNEHLTGVNWINQRDIHTYEKTWAAQLALAESAVGTLAELDRRYKLITSGTTKEG
jgi:hypothetical protein